MEFKNLKLKNIDCVVKFTPQSNKFSSINRVNHIIGIQLTGSAMHYLKDRKVILDSGTIYFFNQKDDYDVDVFEAGLAYSVHFTTYEPIETESFFAHASNADNIVRMVETIEKKMVFNGDELSLMADFYTLCSLFNRIYEKKYFAKDMRIKNAEKYICEHFREQDCIKFAVQHCGISRRRFDDLFKKCFDVTPGKYLINLKIEYAKRFLTTTDAGVSQIAELCGVNDIYYFSKLFKKETGYTPSQYRTKHKNGI